NGIAVLTVSVDIVTRHFPSDPLAGAIGSRSKTIDSLRKFQRNVWAPQLHGLRPRHERIRYPLRAGPLHDVDAGIDKHLFPAARTGIRIGVQEKDIFDAGFN